MPSSVPSLAALESKDDRRLALELRLTRLRPQVAVIRTLADHFEYLLSVGRADGVGDQLVEEIARLARHLQEASGSFAASQRETPLLALDYPLV